MNTDKKILAISDALKGAEFSFSNNRKNADFKVTRLRKEKEDISKFINDKDSKVSEKALQATKIIDEYIKSLSAKIAV